MASTTKNKKELVDFIWEWAENHNDWSKLLISKVVSTESELSPQDRELVFNYFLQSINQYTGLPVLKIVKPTYTPTSKQIELTTLSDITGVNRLAKNQTLTFSKNLTVIYGENGTGKTGYSRILKNLGFSYDLNNIVHSDIYSVVEPKSAVINFSVSGEDKTFIWNGINKDTELQNISVFNNNCVQLSLSDRQLIVSPAGFHLFNLVTTELAELKKLLESKISGFTTTFNWTDTLNIGTPQQTFINGLSESTSEQKLIELSSFTAEQEQELIDKQKELSDLNKTLLENDIKTLTLIENELETILTKIRSAQTLLTYANWHLLITYNKEIAALENTTQTEIKDIAVTNGIEFYETKEFQAFIKSAEDYIKIISKPDYPTSDDLCVYCKQPLENSATELLKSYRALLNDKTQDNLKKLRITKTALINSINPVDISLVFNQSTFGVDGDNKPIQPIEIIEYNKSLAILKTAFIADKVTDGSKFIFDYEKYIKFITDKRTAIQYALKEKNSLLENFPAKEKELKNKIAELKDRKLLSQKVSEIKTSIANLKITKILSSKSSNFSTSSISRKTSEARDQLVEQNFNQLFQEELIAVRKSDLKVELSFGTDKGKSKISHRMNNKYALAEILSEGEQKAIALAAFLTELQLDNINAPVIFDDPVNSLDHRIIDEVGKRSIELSKQRQVIVFTHSILLLHSLIQQSELDTNKQAKVQFEFCKVRNNFGITGILDEVEELNSYTYYTKKLQAVIDTKPTADQDESKLAAEGYGHLRSAIEMTVEDDLLKKTIKRYKKGVAFPSLLRIDGGNLDIHKGKINDIYEKCCVSIAGHSSPSELHTTPTIKELHTDYDQFKTVRRVFVS